MLKWAAVVSERGEWERVPSVSELVGARVGKENDSRGVHYWASLGRVGLDRPDWLVWLFFLLNSFSFSD